MRKNEKALQLSRETLKNLNPALLKKPAGGVCITSYEQTTCPGCVTLHTCP